MNLLPTQSAREEGGDEANEQCWRLVTSFFVPGIPRPGGSKRAFMRPGMKFPVITEDCKKSKDWRAVCALAAREAYRGPLLASALKVTFDFFVTRPGSHFGSGKNAGVAKASAPRFPIVKPDCTKFIRSTEDALTGIVWKDDAQIVEQVGCKRYGDKPGCNVTIYEEADRGNQD